MRRKYCKLVTNSSYYKKFYEHGFGIVPNAKCDRCEVRYKIRYIVDTGVGDFKVCRKCYGRLSARKPIAMLFSPVEV